MSRITLYQVKLKCSRGTQFHKLNVIADGHKSYKKDGKANRGGTLSDAFIAAARYSSAAKRVVVKNKENKEKLKWTSATAYSSNKKAGMN